MAPARGSIVLMGSGELTATMVEVHKELLGTLAPAAQAVFLDTPAGFQLNADQISQKAVAYFKAQVNHPLSVVSFKSAETTTPYQAEQAYRGLRKAAYVLIGPGSPTYAVRQWRHTPIPDILKKNIADGACLVAASAAALTVGSATLPVYEIYKAGEGLHWLEGIDILGHFGLRLVVIPHWNNAEGGNHDTRFCFMGEPRLRTLEALLPPDTVILGLDEHTACIIDLAAAQMRIRGIGRVTVRSRGAELFFKKGDVVCLDALTCPAATKQRHRAPEDAAAGRQAAPEDSSFWQSIHELEAAFHRNMEQHIPEGIINALLELDRQIWHAHEQHEQPEVISQARELLRDMIVALGASARPAPPSRAECIAPLVEELLKLRARFRQQKKWDEADEIRACLERLSVVIEDARQGSQWHLAAAPAQG